MSAHIAMEDINTEEIDKTTTELPRYELLMWVYAHFCFKFYQDSFPKGYLNIWLEDSNIDADFIHRHTEGYVSGFKLVDIRNNEDGKPGTNIIFQIDKSHSALIPHIDIKPGESVLCFQDCDFSCEMRVSFRPSIDDTSGMVQLFGWVI